ncbi:MAG TPA: MBL fold metallo-hydrolase [Blastocatellia bacterium]|nr:MBL fold metallo-hydrolase [Blastocatellia bacterium]
MTRLWSILSILIAVMAISIAHSAIDIAGNSPRPGVTPEYGAVPPQQQTGLEITYIANEGVLISSGGKQVLIDGLHRQYGIHYSFLPAAEREKIETAKAPFDRIDLILVSHMHLDHFHPESVGLHLKHAPKATLVSSQQVVDEVEKNFKDYQLIKARVTAATPPWKERVAMKVAGIDFDILGLGHGSERFRAIQNLGHIIKVGGKKILHIGDADTAAEVFEKFNLDEEGIDIAILPFWFLVDKEGPAVVREHIKPKHIIAAHISPIQVKKVTEQIKQAFPDAVAFTNMLEKRNY